MAIAPMPHALAAYRAAAAQLEQAAGDKPAAGTTGAASPFQALVQAEMKGAVEALRTSEETSMQALAGKASVQEVVEAVSAAELSLQKVTAVRDRVISAYQEIIRMPL